MLLRSLFPSSRMVVLALALFPLLAHAQKKEEKPHTKVVLYKDRIAAQFDTVDCVKNAIKINPLLLFRGELPIYYERALTPKLSLQVGLGVTTRDFLNISGANTDADNFGEGVTIVPKPSYHLSARYYGTDDLEPQGWYMEVEFAYLNYTKDISMRDSITGQLIQPEKKLRDQRIYNDIRLMTGYQMLGATNNWLFDLYGGIGLRDQFMDVVSETVDITTNRYSYSVEHIDDLVPVFFLGIRIGIGF